MHLLGNMNLGTSHPSDVTAVQSGPTSILVSWSPSSDATGYTIDYDSIGGDNGSVVTSGGSTNPLTHTLMDLQNGDTYTICIVATSLVLPSDSVPADKTVGLCESYVPIAMIPYNYDVHIIHSSRSTSDHCRLYNSYLHHNLWWCSKSFSG